MKTLAWIRGQGEGHADPSYFRKQLLLYKGSRLLLLLVYGERRSSDHGTHGDAFSWRAICRNNGNCRNRYWAEAWLVPAWWVRGPVSRNAGSLQCCVDVIPLPLLAADPVPGYVGAHIMVEEARDSMRNILWLHFKADRHNVTVFTAILMGGLHRLVGQKALIEWHSSRSRCQNGKECDPSHLQGRFLVVQRSAIVTPPVTQSRLWARGPSCRL